MTKKYELNGLELRVVRNFYTGLWWVCYVHSGAEWSGPYRTKREAIERLERALS